MKTVLTGATGLVGRALLPRLPGAVVLSRDPARATRTLGGVQAVRWDPETEQAPLEALRGADLVINLAGEPVGEGRWTDEKKSRIRDSRALGTRNLVRALAALDQRPPVLVSASAVGVYGDRGDERLDETASAGRGFLADVCVEWEREAQAAAALGMRVVTARIGVVLAPDGGALAKMKLPFQLGAGGRIGTGQQWMPWVHLDDVCGLLLHAARSADVRGAMNVVAPAPATNAEFTRALGRALHRPTLFPVPRTALRVAFGEMSQILFASQRVVPGVAQRTGYTFRHPDLDGALRAALAGTGSAAA